MLRKVHFFTNIMKLLIAAILIISATGVSMAKNYTASSGKVKVIQVISKYDGETCGAMAPPKYKIDQTSHGKLLVVARKIKFDKGPCAGRKIKLHILVYRSHRGFKGQDKGAISFSNPQFTDSAIVTSGRDSIVINVK